MAVKNKLLTAVRELREFTKTPNLGSDSEKLSRLQIQCDLQTRVILALFDTLVGDPKPKPKEDDWEPNFNTGFFVKK